MLQRQTPLLVAVLAIALFVSCTTVVRPPAAPSTPEHVLLVTHGWSSSLILRDRKGNAFRWAYGDWRYYALGQQGPFETIAAVLWPTQAALGRQTIEAAPETPRELIARLGIGIDESYAMSVERDAVVRLLQRLNDLHAANIDTLHFNPDYRLQFVRHPEPYTFFNNSNRMIAVWLRELGCDVRGFPLKARWRVEAAE
jgi:hypothetical protein